jgi:hypothetical protein
VRRPLCIMAPGGGFYGGGADGVAVTVPFALEPSARGGSAGSGARAGAGGPALEPATSTPTAGDAQ